MSMSLSQLGQVFELGSEVDATGRPKFVPFCVGLGFTEDKIEEAEGGSVAKGSGLPKISITALSVIVVSGFCSETGTRIGL